MQSLLKNSQRVMVNHRYRLTLSISEDVAQVREVANTSPIQPVREDPKNQVTIVGKFILQNSALHLAKHAISVKRRHISLKLCCSCPSSRPPSNDKRQSRKDFHKVTQSDGTDGDLFVYNTDVVYFNFSPESNDCKKLHLMKLMVNPAD